MFYTIYKTTNLINGKIYIGKHQTKDLNDNYMGSGKNIRRALHKYGIENFKKEVLFVFDNEDEMNAKEAELVTEEFVKEDNNYNLCPGGQGGFGYLNNAYWDKESRSVKCGSSGGFANKDKMSVESYKRMQEGWKLGGLISKENLSKYNDAVSRGIIDNGFKGKTHTEEWKDNHSKIMKEKQSGSKNSQFGTMWITDGFNNKKIKKEDTIPEGWYKGYKPKKK